MNYCITVEINNEVFIYSTLNACNNYISVCDLNVACYYIVIVGCCYGVLSSHQAVLEIH